MSTVTDGHERHRDELRDDADDGRDHPADALGADEQRHDERAAARWRRRTASPRGSRAAPRRARSRTGGCTSRADRRIAAMGPTRSTPITGAVTRNHVITASGRTPSPMIDTPSSRCTSTQEANSAQAIGTRAAQQLPRREVVADVPARHEAGDRGRDHHRGRTSSRAGPPAPTRRCRTRDRRRRRCCVSLTASPQSNPSTPRFRNAPSTWMGRTKRAVSPMIVAGACFRIAKPPSSRSDIVIGASGGRIRRSWAAGRALGPPAARGGRGASAATSGAAQSTAPFYRPGARREPGRLPEPPHCWAWRATTRRPTATASPTCTTTGTATSPMPTRAPRAARGAGGDGAVLELGVGSGRLALPLAARGVEVHGIDASDGHARLACGPSRAREAIHLTTGDMADLALVDPPPFAVVLAAFNTLFNLGTRRGAAALPRPGGGAPRRRRAPRDRGLRARRAGRRRIQRRRSPRATSAPTRWCCRSAATTSATRRSPASTSTSPRRASGCVPGTSATPRRPSSTPWPRPPASTLEWRHAGLGRTPVRTGRGRPRVRLPPR